MAEPVIETRALTRRFAGVTALRAVDCNVGAGEAVAVFGPNGAGKTTLLRLLATALRPTAGSLRLFGSSAHAGGAAVRGRIGVLSHQSFLYPDLTPAQNLAFYARMFGIAAPAERVRAVLDHVGLTGWAHRSVRTLSRGLEQRCALARALLHQPDLLLLDEPFAGLDTNGADQLSVLLQQAQQRRVTLVMTSHDSARALALCQRALILVRGQLVWDGSIGATAQEAFLRTYRDAIGASVQRHAAGIARA